MSNRDPQHRVAVDYWILNAYPNGPEFAGR